MRRQFSLCWLRSMPKAAALAVFPELALSGYAIDDLLLQDTLHAAIAAAVERLVATSTDLLPLILVGAPLRYGGRLYNCALAIHRGQLLVSSRRFTCRIIASFMSAGILRRAMG